MNYAELSQHIAHSFYSYEIIEYGKSRIGLECMTCQETLIELTEENE
jgi:hypothetical protein